MSFPHSERLDVTVEQLKSIYGQLQEVFNDKFSQILPPDQVDDNDPLKRQVQIQLQDFLSGVMEMAANSLNVVNADMDGRSIKDVLLESEREYMEPFDLELNEKVRQLYQEWEDQTVKVSQLRQNGPLKVNEIYNGSKEEYLSRLDARINSLSQDEAMEDDADTDVALAPMDTTIKQDYQEALQNLYDTGQRIPDIRGDVEKLKRLVAYFDRAG
ncbi:hypothetical protein NCAS_0G01240 [Naumovozyma castellii]|uniref:Uncharacterized protein n=1 Tax=Naumovozyma castellii TaxID=27288 RepID=G0VHX7_NAUCA|nr:hypothetical protein NCAS_0G01240 [Naumovozyma castellii CBS 4309]CCC71011.1 hypothetical protein NCAS_0G01240 [Naumovozyma castellii CBS 4309]